jgi:NAD(P)-dependent dehydrogenase (short-subunit alcohol dehydrogenase family)
MKVAVVTGSGRGIGSEIARGFAAEGYAVAIADRDDSSGKETAEKIISAGGVAVFVHADISLPSDVEALMKITVSELGSLDVLINNAGFGIWKSPYDLTVEEWDAVINTNLRGTFLCTRSAAKYIKIQGGGSVINIASTRAFMSEANSEAYAASKGGIVALTHAFAASLSKDNIRVNCISPGWIETGDYESLRDADHAQHFSGRVGRPSDIWKACMFLVENDFINGENIIIDGGMTRKMIYKP